MNPICRDFLGSWNLERHIDDFLLGHTGFFTGQATIIACDTNWKYSETGQFTIEDQVPLKSERQYFWFPNAYGFDIYFDDHEFFHRFKIPRNPKINDSPTAHHWCDPDDYHVRYDLRSFPDWSSIWRVKGPSKCYRLRSTYKRHDF